MRVLFDANVILDVLLHRPGLVEDAARLLHAAEVQQLTGLVCATTVTTISYLIQRHADAETARTSVEQILSIFEVVPVTRTVLTDALTLAFSDFEDAVQHEAARHARADALVTRNTPDFTAATLPVYTPRELAHTL